jgi:hypothetical protein
MSMCACGGSVNERCASNNEKKKIIIDFLYLDLSICERCKGTESNFDEAVKDVSGVIKAAGYDMIVNKIHIDTIELARKYELISSPTIRINGRDISCEVKESACEECGQLCGEGVDCRVWEHEGEEYVSPPKTMIIDEILNEIFTDRSCQEEKKEYRMPKNLELFFNEG